jgi:hypothetical protein
MDARRAAFAADFGVRPIKWSRHNLVRLLNHTGERPERIAVARRLLEALGMGGFHSSLLGIGGVFDHGELWARDGLPVLIVGHPYWVHDDPGSPNYMPLAELARWSPTLRVVVDDRPSCYGFRTHHVRIEPPEDHTPYRLPRSTRRTRIYAHAARKALRDAPAGG